MPAHQTELMHGNISIGIIISYLDILHENNSTNLLPLLLYTITPTYNKTWIPPLGDT